MSAFVVERLHKSYPGGHCAIAGLSLQAAAGEFVAVVGPSGAGKSTLLKILAGLDTQFEGRVQCAAPEHTRLVFQEPRLMPWLTVLDNLLLVLPERTAASRQRARELLDQVGLTHAAGLFVHQLSGGMQRRVALARAFITRPQLLLLDEPFQSLDAPTAAELRQQLLRLWQHSGCCVLMVTHQLEEAVALADRVVFLSASPARMLRVLDVPLERPRNCQSAAVQALCQHWLEEAPDLLRGLAPLAAGPQVIT